MTVTPTSCPLTGATSGEPDCARRLVLNECLARREREAQVGVVNTGRYQCRYVVWGRGPTLVLVPGMGMNMDGYVMLMARLQTAFRCISFDLPDGAADGARVRTYRHDDHVADLFALLDHLAIDRCILYGSSFGSTIALSALHCQSARFSQGILQGGFAYRPLARSEVLAASFARFLPGRVRHLPLVERILAAGHREPFLAREPEVWAFFVEQNMKMHLSVLANRALMMHRLDLRPILPAIHTPMLVVCGDRDPLVSQACEQVLLRNLPSAARVEIEQCGHFPQLTHPEVLAEAMQQWLRSVG